MNLRKRFGTGIMLVILGIALVAIVVTGFGTDGMGGMGSMTGQATTKTVARVGDRRITDTEIYALIDSQYRQAVRANPTLDRAQFVEQQFDQLLEQVISQAAIAEFGSDLGLVVPDIMVDRVLVRLASEGGFRTATGEIDVAALDRQLQSQGITRQQLRDDIFRGELIRMTLGPVAGAVRMPRAVATEYAALFLEQRRGNLGAVPTAVIARSLQPNDQQIAAFYQQNPRRFALPERRVIRYALIGREQLGDTVRATDADIQQYYQQNQAQYGPVETRNLQRVVLQDEAAARAFVQRVQGGTAFNDAAQQAGFAPADINFAQQTREQFTQVSTAEVAQAAFAAQAGSVVGPIRTDLGFQVVRVEALNQTPGRPLESVRSEIVTAVESRKLSEQLNAALERIETRLADGASFEELVQAERLSVQTTPPVTAAGAAPGVQGALPGQPFQVPPALMPIVTAGYNSDSDEPVLEMTQDDAQAALISLGNTIPPAVPPLAEIRDQVRAALIQETALQRARQVADAIVQRINGGMAPAQAFAQAGVALDAPRPITLTRLQIANPGQPAPAPLRALFSIPQGRARLLPAPNGQGWIVVHHAQRTPGNLAADPRGAEMVGQAQREFSEMAAPELAEQFARQLAAAVTVERDEAEIAAVRARLRGQ